MAITFPNSPSIGDTHIASNGLQYTYDGEKWTTIGTNSAGTWTRTGTTVSLTTATDDLNVDSGTLFVDASTNNVGIGTTSPTRSLMVAAGSTSANGILVTGSNSPSYRIEETNSSVAAQFGLDGSASYFGTSTNHPQVFNTNSTERARIDSSGNVGIGTSSPQRKLEIRQDGTYALKVGGSSGADFYLELGQPGASASPGINYTGPSASLRFLNNGNDVARFDSSGRLLVGTSSASSNTGVLVVQGYAGVTAGEGTLDLVRGNNVTGAVQGLGSINFGHSQYQGASIDALAEGAWTEGSSHPAYLSLATTASGAPSPTERMRLDSSGRVGIGTSSPGVTLDLNAATAATRITSSTGTNPAFLNFNNAAGNAYVGIESSSGGGAAVGNAAYALHLSHQGAYPINFSTNNALRATIDSSGNVLIGKTSASISNAGIEFDSTAQDAMFTTYAATPVYVNRLFNDGVLISLQGQSTEEGSINVNGTTVSYNGAHLSRWSQLPGGAERTEILRGSVLSNIDEMCEWGDEDNEQLNRMQVSTVEGDRNVSGVFQGWDDDDDTYTNDFYCAMTGDFVIRIAQGTTVARGDLLMSAGDGTAKPQDDDIVRSKTIAKVTSTNVSETYADGSYCVPCVLMAC